MAAADHTDEQVLADPGSFTAGQVQDAFARSAPEQIETAKELEAAGQARKGVVEWQPPAPKPREDNPKFPRERLLGKDGPEIIGHPRHVIAGALHDDDRKAFTRDDAAKAVEKFLSREVETDEVDE